MKQNIFDELLKAFGNAFDNQKFYNCRMAILEYVEKIKDINTVIATTHLERHRSLCEISCSLLYTMKDGRVIKEDEFYRVDLSMTGGLIPQYLIDKLDSQGSVDFKTSFEDLKIFYNEKNIRMIDSCDYKELIQVLRTRGVRKVIFKDRVFYTKVEMYSQDKIIYRNIAILENVPSNIYNCIYPFKTFEVIL